MAKQYQNPDVLRRLYWDEEKTAMETADELDCSEATVIQYMKKFDIPRRRDGGGWREDRPYEDRELMEQLYYGEGLSTVEIAKRFDCSQPLITQWMQKHGIDTRSPAERYRSTPDIPIETTPYGYERVYHNYKGEREQVGIHKLIAVAEYGIEALEGKVAHHENNIPWDNRPENIKLMSPEDHGRHHAEERWARA